MALRALLVSVMMGTLVLSVTRKWMSVKLLNAIMGHALTL